MTDKKNNIWLKIVAAIVFTASAMMFAFSMVGVVAASEKGLSSRDVTSVRKEIYDERAMSCSIDILSDIADNGSLDRRYDCAPALSYVILKSNTRLDMGDLLAGRYDTSMVIEGSVDRNAIAGAVCGMEGWRYYNYTRNNPLLISYCSVELPDQTTDYDCSLVLMSDRGTQYYVLYSIDYNAAEGTVFAACDKVARYISWCDANGAGMMVISGILSIVTFVALMYLAKNTISFGNKIPYAILLTLLGGVEAACMLCIVGAFDGYVTFNSIMIISLTAVGLGASFFLWFSMNTVTRFKARAFMRNTLLYYICIPARAFLKNLNENTSLVVKAVIFSAVVGVIQLLGLAVVASEFSAGLFLFVIYKAIEVAVIIWFALQFNRVKEGMSLVASGNTDATIDTTHMLPAFKSHAHDIANVSEGINRAVEERMKSERMKTELITNVSHDIKTPLTSIINYVDLMEKHGTDDPEMQEYLEVLDRQSERLKKLIEDLIEASKASSGAIEMNIEPVNVSVLLSQAAGEFEEKLKQKELTNVVSVPEEELTIRADGRYLWRVIDNLMGNICKYAMPNTRVYVDLTSKGNTAQIAFKNISATELNISAEELTERFVRGDKSRNTEGSGLGLSIAKSLTEHMGGTMDIHIDGDLFKVTLTFPKE